jgi:hypothetical protein
MARLKYDGYQDYLAGVRFIESLASWIQQFGLREEREKAYDFVRKALVYVGPAEMLRLVELLYPNYVEPRLIRAVAEVYGIKPYHVWANQDATAAFHRLLRRTLFIGLSEGARLDLFRRANSGVVSNEQILLATYPDADKWDKLLSDLRADLKDDSATFAFVYLIDDFVGSGITFIRQKPDRNEWKGKLVTFRQNVSRQLATHFSPDLTICVHHYLATAQAVGRIAEKWQEAREAADVFTAFPHVEFTYGAVLPADLPIDRSPMQSAADFIPLAKKYFDGEDPSLKNKHTEEGGTDNVALGFAGCALPLILDHNTPNNSVALLWAETDGSEDEPRRHAMRPLFHRRQRHS